ncbi:pacearchaeosortase [archaeon]|jgi:exosortase/archaeosortase family protein|nr:pacearchaeosortase [archaeon]MBT7128857.1 pacearchaeosortase [archaeon]
MQNQAKKILSLFMRYIAIIAIGLGNLYILYKVLTPLTIHATNSILSLFTRTSLAGNIIHIRNAIIEIAPPCVAASAFFLLIALILSTSNIKPKTRAYAILAATATLFTLNITRILLLIPFIGQPYFETLHWIFWHLISIVLVLVTYLTIIKTYKIKSIPVYSDFKYLKSLAS